MPTCARARGGAGLLVVAIALALLTACGGGSGSSAASCSSAPPSSGSGALTATEKDFTIELDKTDLTAGTYKITVVNQGRATHDLAVEQNGKKIAGSDSIAPCESTTLTVDLTAGDYVFYCSIGNHRKRGMETDVTVT